MEPHVRLDGASLEERPEGLYLCNGGDERRLSPLAGLVVRAADGTRSVPQLALLAETTLGRPCTAQEIWTVLDALADAGVDVGPVGPPAGDAGDDAPVQLSRRRLLQGAGAAAGAVVALGAASRLPAAAQNGPSQNGAAQEAQRKKNEEERRKQHLERDRKHEDREGARKQKHAAEATAKGAKEEHRKERQEARKEARQKARP